MIYIPSLWCICHIQRYIPINVPPGSSCVQCVRFRFIFGCIVSVSMCLVCVCCSCMSLLEDNKSKSDLCGSGTFTADRWSFTHTRHTWSQWCSSLMVAGATFIMSFDPRDHCCTAIFTLWHSTCQHPSYHHTLWDLLCWQLDWMIITATSV